MAARRFGIYHGMPLQSFVRGKVFVKIFQAVEQFHDTLVGITQNKPVSFNKTARIDRMRQVVDLAFLNSPQDAGGDLQTGGHVFHHQPLADAFLAELGSQFCQCHYMSIPCPKADYVG